MSLISKTYYYSLAYKRTLQVFFLLCLTIIAKNLLFKIETDHLLPFSYFNWNIYKIILYFAPLVLPSIVISCFVFITEKKYWTIAFLFLLDLWSLTNIIFYRSYDTLFSICELQYASNMAGSWSSIHSFWKPFFGLFPGTTILYWALFVLVMKSDSTSLKKSWKLFFLSVVVCIVGSEHRCLSDKNANECPSILVENQKSIFSPMNPFYGSQDYFNFRYKYPLYSPVYFVSRYSIVAYFPMAIMEWVNMRRVVVDTPNPTEKEMEPFISSDSSALTSPNETVILLLVESFESWLLNNEVIDGKEVCPNLQSLLNNDHCVYFPHVKSQTKYGNSGDGQMIAMTGLLPIQFGAACEVFGHNDYPSLAKLFSCSSIVNPCKHIWNQDVMNVSYGFGNIVEPSSQIWEDADVIKKTCETLTPNSFVLSITSSTHVPFEIGKNGLFEQNESIPEQLRAYMNAFHYADSCIGMLIDKINSDTLFKNTSIIITGDHTIFKGPLRKEFEPWVRSRNYNIPLEEGFVPLIIYSPKLHNRSIQDTIYQMDIYPTILNLVGCQNYFWKGFGVNVLNDSLRRNRPINEDEAFILSNKIIINDYLKCK